jgi:hypothetical protein
MLDEESGYYPRLFIMKRIAGLAEAIIRNVMNNAG